MSAPLVATCWTHAGPSRPVDGQMVSPFDLDHRVEAVAAAGYVGIGFTVEDLVAGREQLSWPNLRRRCEDRGLHHIEVEFLTGWWTRGERRARSDEMRGLLLQAAEDLQARQIKIAPDMAFDPAAPPPPAVDVDHWAIELHRLAQQAKDAGTRVALEVLPMSNLADFTEASRLIDAADHPAAGLTVDIWHVERGPSTLADLARIPVSQVFCVELNDAAAEPVGDLYHDTMHHRLYCGTGSFDVTGFIRTLQTMGFPGPWGVEIISDDHHAQPLETSLVEVFRTTQAQFH